MVEDRFILIFLVMLMLVVLFIDRWYKFLVNLLMVSMVLLLMFNKLINLLLGKILYVFYVLFLNFFMVIVRFEISDSRLLLLMFNVIF